MTECWLEKHPEYGGCCCKCKYRLRVFSQGGQRIPGSWICIAAFVLYRGEDTAYIGNFEHGMCELYEARSSEGVVSSERDDDVKEIHERSSG